MGVWERGGGQKWSEWGRELFYKLRNPAIPKNIFRNTPLAMFWCIPEKGLFQDASQKLWPKPEYGNFAPCNISCKIGGLQTLMKEQYSSKTPFLTFFHLSKCKTQLHGFFGNSKQFLDALAPLGSMLESESVSQSLINVFEIL